MPSKLYCLTGANFFCGGLYRLRLIIVDRVSSCQRKIVAWRGQTRGLTAPGTSCGYGYPKVTHLALSGPALGARSDTKVTWSCLLENPPILVSVNSG